jgi:kinesin family protein C1
VEPKVFQYDKVFDQTASQQDVFEDVSDVVKSVLDGQKVCVFAYGQTGTGKTFTMKGGSEDKQGIIPRSMELIFKMVSEQNSDKIVKQKVKVEIGCFELYLDTIQDLLKQNSSKNVTTFVPTFIEVNDQE